MKMSTATDTVIWDAVVVGAGIEGSATAYHLAKKKQKTLLLEQFGLPHSRGSSHGQSRIVRYGYEEDYYTAMMPDAFNQWHDIEKKANVALIKETGILTVDQAPYVEYNKKKAVLSKANINFHEFSDQEVKTRYPYIHYGPDYKFLLEEKSGIIRADKALLTLQRLYINDGGMIQDEEKLLDISPGTILTLRTNKGVHKTKTVILTPGPWAKQVLNPLGLQLPLSPQRIRVFYWKEKNPGTCAQFPGFISVTGSHVYGLQELEYPNMMKICYHYGPEVNPDERDIPNAYREDLDTLEKYVTDHFPCLENKPCITESCMYTVTPDRDFILDRHPHFKNIVIGAGFSGHGFKLAPVVGKLLTELALNEKTSYDLSPFAINRFYQSPKAHL